MTRATAALTCLLIALGACGFMAGRDPASITYGAERTACVYDNDSGAAAARCMRAVDAKYHQDGGRP